MRPVQGDEGTEINSQLISVVDVGLEAAPMTVLQVESTSEAVNSGAMEAGVTAVDLRCS
jgi:hypothetical protein